MLTPVRASAGESPCLQKGERTGPGRNPSPIQTLALAAVYSAGLMAEIEFMWTLFQLRSRWIHIGCGLRRAEVVAVKIEDLQLREDHWVLADLVGKGGHMRTVPAWVKSAVDVKRGVVGYGHSEQGP